MSDDGVLDQNEIERLLGGGGNTGSGGTSSSPESSSSDGTISQSDLDALFGKSSGADQSSAGSAVPSDSTISQNDLDALFNTSNSSGNSPNSPSSQTKSSASGPLDQRDLDALFQSTSGGNTEVPPSPGPIDQAALDVLFGSSASKPSVVPTSPTFVPTPTFDPTQPSSSAINNNYASSNNIGISGGSGIGGGGGGFGSAMPDMGNDDEDGLPHGDLNYLLERAEKSIQSIASERLIPTEVIEFQFPEFGGTVPSTEHATLDQISEVELNVKIELGRTDMYLEDVLKLRKGSVVPLDKTAGDPVDIYVNGRLLARGEVLVMNENFCVRVAELLAGAIPME
ncbi:MAG: flagellar motor switch protein FliN [Planctomycetaceae bacterium]|jgi:flagellar motor switch protein FliN/FliY|nr:flagellar motor switch protein FliN [Planctomycetaceae bacterium]